MIVRATIAAKIFLAKAILLLTLLAISAIAIATFGSYHSRTEAMRTASQAAILGERMNREVNAAVGDAAKARALFSGMFERKQNNVQKGRFGQALAQVFSEPGTACVVPQYIRDAVVHACQVGPAKP